MNLLEQVNTNVGLVSSKLVSRLDQLKVGEKVGAGALADEVSVSLGVDKVLVQSLLKHAVSLDPTLQSRQGKNGGIYRV